MKPLAQTLPTKNKRPAPLSKWALRWRIYVPSIHRERVCMYSNLNKDYSHDRQKRKKGNPKSLEHKRFENWLHKMPCQVPGCDTRPIECHHAPFKAQGGSHDRQVALCGPHHNDGPGGVHHMSREDGNVLMGCNIEELAEDNWLLFKEQDKQ